MAEAFGIAWKRRFGETAAFGHALRTLDIPWIRFHALPESKRYADTEAEFEILLGRANALGAEVLGEGAQCWMVVEKCDPGVIGFQSNDELIAKYGLAPAFEVRWKFPEDDDEDALDFAFHAGLVEWRAGTFDPLLKQIANDEMRVVWLSQDLSSVFAPYDGGFDLFPPTISEVERLRGKHADWLSCHPSGL